MLVIRTQPSLNRDFTLLSLFIIFLMVLMSGWVAFETYESQKREITTRLKSASARMDNALSLDISHARYIMQAIGKQLIEQDISDHPKIAKTFQSFDVFDKADRMIFSWVSRDQQLVVNSHFGVLENAIDVSDRDYVKRALSEPWNITIGRPIKGRISKRWVLPMSMGIAQENGTFLGVLYVGLIIDTLKDEASRAVGDKAIDFAVTNRAFSLMTQSFTEDGGYTRYFDLTELLKQDFIAPQKGLYSTALPWDSRSLYSYYRTADSLPFIYFLTYSREESMKALRQLMIARIFQLVAVGTFLLFVLWTVRKRIIQPVIGLSHYTRQATLGTSFDAQANSGPQEIQSLTREIYKFWLYVQERKRIESELRLKLAELVRIRESANLTNKVKSEFFTFIAESLKPAMQSIREQSETIKDQHFGPITNQKYLKNADDVFYQASAVLRTLDEMIRIAAAESGLIALKEEEVNTLHVLQKTIRGFYEEHHHSYQVQLDTSSPIPNMLADKLRLRQLFACVLAVAAQNISSGDSVRISGNIRGGRLNLFFSFVSDGKRQNSHAPSLQTSMSVAIARLLIALHDGVFEMKSTPDRVTTITLRFPAERLQ